MKTIFHTKTLVLILGFILVITGAVNSTIENVTGGVSCFAAGIIIVVLFHFDVKSFNVFGLATELRGKIHEADMILEKLRGISLPVSEIAITTASQAGGYETSVPRKKLYDYVLSITEELKGMQVPLENIEKVKESWYLATAIEMTIPIHQLIQYKIESHRSRILQKNEDINLGKITISDNERAELKELVSAIECDYYKYYEEANALNTNFKSYPEHFTGVIKNLRGVPETEKAEMIIKINEYILDLEYLINERDIRRPDVWFSQN